MTMQSIDISGFNSGVQKGNKKPFLFQDDAFAVLNNAYVWREEVKKREGLKYIGRFRRSFATASVGNSTGASWAFNLYSTYTPAITPESTAEIQPGSVVITIAAGPNIVFTDQGNGLLTSPTASNIGYINYLTGDVVLTHTGGVAASTASFAYYPTLPAMGITTREQATVNDEQTLWYDTKYCYIHSGADFSEYLPTEAVTWNGTDSDFFWSTNYRGSESQERLYFVTNFVNSTGSPMRYTDNATWEDFTPIIGGQQQTEVLTRTLAAGSASYGPVSLTELPILEGSVVIYVTKNNGSVEEIIFRDTPKDGTLVSSGLNTGTIVYATGAITLNFNPVLPGSKPWTVTVEYLQAGNFLFSARVLIPYYGRLVAFNTWEGTTNADAVNIANRCRFSQIGNPVQQDAWRQDTYGKGGFIDAPINEDILSARFFKNTLIVFFERSTWRLQYVGEYGIPFVWERISSDWGSESTFSTVIFDNGVLAVGDKAIVASNGGDVKRIDEDIPQIVYSFLNVEGGPKRVHGIRDYQKELVYWCYPDFDTLYQGQKYPNKTLVFNYKNNTYAFFRNNVTCYGRFQYPASITWDRADVFWDSLVSWSSNAQEKAPIIVSGNQKGFAHFYGYPDIETASDSTIDALDQESLTVTNVTVSAGVSVTLEVKNHNLLDGETIYLTGLIFVDISTPSTPVAGSTTLNNKIYGVQVVDTDNIILTLWNDDLNEYSTNFDVTNVGTYVGNGVIALFPNIEIRTKDFNPLRKIGQNIKTSSIDFLFDASYPAPIGVEMRMNTSANAIGNVSVGNTTIESANSKNGYITDVTQDVSPTCIIENKNHCLLTGDKITIQNVVGSTELNGNEYEITFIDTDNFSVEEAAISTYVSGGYWSQTESQYFTLTADYAWHRFYATCYGQYLSIVLSYNDVQMNRISTHRQNFVLNAMKIWYRPGGKNIFGK